MLDLPHVRVRTREKHREKNRLVGTRERHREKNNYHRYQGNTRRVSLYCCTKSSLKSPVSVAGSR